MAEGFRVDHHLHFLLADQRMREIDVAAHVEFFRGVDSYAPVAFYDFQRLQHLEVAALAAQLANAGMFQHLHERLRGAVQNGNLDGVDVDENVVDAARIDGGEEMLRRGQEHALLHQAGRVADARDVVALRFDWKIVEVNAPKNDAGIRGSSVQPDVAEHSGVKPHTFSSGRAKNGGLKHERL